MNNIIRKNTKEEAVAHIILDDDGNKRCVTYISGAIIYCALPRDLYLNAQPTDTFVGQVDLISKMLPSPRYIGKIKEDIGEVEHSHIDNFLYKIKLDLSENGFKPGDPTWEKRLDDSIDLWNTIYKEQTQ